MNPNGITKDEISPKMKACFQIFGDILAFVGWLAPAYGKDEVNPTGSQKGRPPKRKYTFDFGGFTFCRSARGRVGKDEVKIIA